MLPPVSLVLQLSGGGGGGGGGVYPTRNICPDGSNL